MYGRYGNDILSRHLSILALILLLVSYIPYLRFLWFVAVFVMIFSTFRMFSKNTSSRRKELEKYLGFGNKIKKFINLKKEKFRNRKTHKYLKCKNCKANLRVPKGKGKIEITCPKCKSTIIKRT